MENSLGEPQSSQMDHTVGATSRSAATQPLSATTPTPNNAAAIASDADVKHESDDWKQQRDVAKAMGDQAFREGKFGDAIQQYSLALSLDPDHATILSNRSAAYLKRGEKSKALHDAQACVRIGTMGVKGASRLAAALQSLGRYEQAFTEWNIIVAKDPTHVAAKQGVDTCRPHVEASARQKEEEERLAKDVGEGADEGDELDDFFNEVEEAAQEVVLAKVEEGKPLATNAIKNQKRNLGTSVQQIDRLLQENYKWRNLNPFFVLDLDHVANKDDISRRYKALSLLLHPDKNRNNPRAQDAYDEVLKAKAALDDEHKASHVRQLIEQGMRQGKADFDRLGSSHGEQTLQSMQSKAVQKIFAQIEFKRREIEQRERNFSQREQQKEEDDLEKERSARTFDKNWKQEERVDKRIGSWRNFQNKRPKKA
jgi:DnaJ family protein C protein 8